MGHGKKKQSHTDSGLGAVKETREQKRKRLADEAKAREQCMKILPYALGFVVFLTLAFTLWVHSLPPPPVKVIHDMDIPNLASGNGLTFEEALKAEINSGGEEMLHNLFDQVKADDDQANNDAENVMNLDGEEL